MKEQQFFTIAAWLFAIGFAAKGVWQVIQYGHLKGSKVGFAILIPTLCFIRGKMEGYDTPWLGAIALAGVGGLIILLVLLWYKKQPRYID